MPETSFQQSEAFLQWIWENLLFEFRDLKTTCGKIITIINQGSQNVSDGPDFKQAEIEIDGMRLYGDIELHTRSSNWFSHKHHLDENYNAVILHVVTDHSASDVFCEDGSRPLTLNLQPYLSKDLQIFIQSFERPKDLPCASSLHIISNEVFEQQIEKAHREYLEKKATDFLNFYPAGMVISRAWKQALILSVWDGLGISQNREAMQSVAVELFQKKTFESKEEMLDQALNIAGFGDSGSELRWNMKAVRPYNHPKVRIKQAVLLSNHILEQPFPDFLKTDALKLWSSWLEQSTLKNSGHFQILFGTIFLPSLYVLGKLLAHQTLSEKVFQEWVNLKTPIPTSLLSRFQKLPISEHMYRRKLGAVHQLNAYCNSGKCSECFVLKKAILS